MESFKNCIIYFFFSFSSLIAQDNQLFYDWSSQEIKKANTALNEDYLTLEEKNIFLVLNLVRINPPLFSKTILANYRGVEGFSNDFLKHRKYLNSLSNRLLETGPLNPVFPDKELWKSAECHATKSGKSGVIGHRRVGCKEPDLPYSECCSYGLDMAIDIVIQLLIDYKVRDLSHREIMLNPKQTIMGVSIKPHKNYSYNAVLDFSSDL